MKDSLDIVELENLSRRGQRMKRGYQSGSFRVRELMGLPVQIEGGKNKRGVLTGRVVGSTYGEFFVGDLEDRFREDALGPFLAGCLFPDTWPVFYKMVVGEEDKPPFLIPGRRLTLAMLLPNPFLPVRDFGQRQPLGDWSYIEL